MIDALIAHRNHLAASGELRLVERRRARLPFLLRLRERLSARLDAALAGGPELEALWAEVERAASIPTPRRNAGSRAKGRCGDPRAGLHRCGARTYARRLPQPLRGDPRADGAADPRGHGALRAPPHPRGARRRAGLRLHDGLRVSGCAARCSAVFARSEGPEGDGRYAPTSSASWTSRRTSSSPWTRRRAGRRAGGPAGRALLVCVRRPEPRARRGVPRALSRASSFRRCARRSDDRAGAARSAPARASRREPGFDAVVEIGAAGAGGIASWARALEAEGAAGGRRARLGARDPRCRAEERRMASELGFDAKALLEEAAAPRGSQRLRRSGLPRADAAAARRARARSRAQQPAGSASRSASSACS